jgi:hypothetical protein
MAGVDGSRVTPPNVEIDYERINAQAFRHSQSSNSYALSKTPYFDGTDYTAWKNKMMYYLKGIDNSIWKVVNVGYTVVDEDNLTAEEEKWDHKNAQATNALYSALCKEEYNRIEGCTSAKKIWDTLERVHIGASQLRNSKIQALKAEIEQFVMKRGETMTEMYDRLMVLINGIRALGSKDYDDEYVKLKISGRSLQLITI